MESPSSSDMPPAPTAGDARQNARAGAAFAVYPQYGAPSYDDMAAEGRSGGLGGVVPYVVYGVLALLLAAGWFAWVKATVAGSVMGEPMHFAAGVILLAAVLVVGVIIAVVAGLLARDRAEAGTFDALAVSMGKTSIGMGAFVVVWAVLMFLAA